MEITVNGDHLELPAPITIAALLERYRLENQPCAVEVNRNLVTKRDHGTYTLDEGDVVEVVTLVGGG